MNAVEYIEMTQDAARRFLAQKPAYKDFVSYEEAEEGILTFTFRTYDDRLESFEVSKNALIKLYTEDKMDKDKDTELQGLTGNIGNPGPLGEKPVEVRGKILDEAKKIINGARNVAYGNPEDNFQLIAQLWSLYLQKRYRKPDSFVGYLSSQDVAIMMAYMKMARITSGFNMRDSFVDCAGYLGIAADFGTAPDIHHVAESKDCDCKREACVFRDNK